MIGSWLASDPETYDVGEYNAFYAAYRLVPEVMPGIQPPAWAPHLEHFLGEVQEHAARFIDGVARSENCDSYVDSSPRNILIAGELAARFPDALFVLVLRHYSGVVQSLGRTGWPWVPASVEGRAVVWADAYDAAEGLPPDRTVAISYDRLCAEPEPTLSRFSEQLRSHGIRTDRLDLSVLGYSHSHVLGQPRPTLVDATGQLTAMPSIDAQAWTPAIHATVLPHVRQVEERLRDRYPEYSEPGGWVAPATPSAAPLVSVDDAEATQVLSLVAAEYVVDDLERVEELLVDLLGLEVVQRTAHPDFDAELVVLSAGPVAVSLLHPTDVGDRPPFPVPDPRLAQLTFTVDDSAAFSDIRRRLVEAGAAVVNGGPRMFYFPEKFIEGVFGSAPVLVVLDSTVEPEAEG